MLIFGAGRLGGAVTDVLAARFPQHRYVLVSRNRERAEKRANLARYTCAQWNSYPEIVADATNLMDVRLTADLLQRYKPDVVFNATTPFPWWMIDQTTANDRDRIHAAGPGMWCALDTILPLRLSEALTQIERTTYVNGCYPDMVNAFLSEQQRAPLCGIGNLSNLVPGLTLAFAAHLGVAPSALRIQLVCHHFTSLNATTKGKSLDAPYRLLVTAGEQALHFSEADDLPFELVNALARRVRGSEGQSVTTNSAATVIASFLNQTDGMHHTPGPCGLPGGYPVKIVQGSVTLDLPKGLTDDAAIAVNSRAQQFDGVQHVVAGAVTATDTAAEAFRDIVGFDLPVVTSQNNEEIATETIQRLNLKYGWELALW